MKLNTDRVWKLIRDFSIKALFKRLGIALTGVWGWLAVEVAEKLMNKYAKPAWDYLIRKGIKLREVKKGKKNAKRKRNAKSPTDYLNELNRK